MGAGTGAGTSTGTGTEGAAVKILRDWFPRIGADGISLGGVVSGGGGDEDDGMEVFTSMVASLHDDVATTVSGTDYWLVGRSVYAINGMDYRKVSKSWLDAGKPGGEILEALVALHVYRVRRAPQRRRA